MPTIEELTAELAEAKAKLATMDAAEKRSSIDATARIKAITTAEAATGREALAAHLAYETEMSAEAAVAALEAAPKAAAETDPAAYAARRQAAAGLAVPGGNPKTPTASLDPRAVYAKRAEARTARR